MANKTTEEGLPLVSIVIPVYNGADFLREAIDSALAQTYPNIEVLVINDGSSDNGATAEIARSYGGKIRYFEKENGGVSTALNYGIEKMNGEYFSWLSHDDAYEKEKIEHQVNLLKGKSRYVAYCSSKLIDAKSHFIGTENPNTVLESVGVADWKIALINLFDAKCYGGCGFLIPKAAFDECGGFDKDFRYVQDILMWARLFISGYGLVYSPYADVLSRVHEKQQTQLARNRFYSESKMLCDLVLPDLTGLSTKENNFLYKYAQYNAKYNNSEVVKKCIEAAKANGLFSNGQKIKLRLVGAYGSVRPTIRKVYYKVFRRINTN